VLIGTLMTTAILLGIGGPSNAALLTVAWVPDGSNDGTGTGLLGATTVTYNSAPGFNSGTTLSNQFWAAFVGTNGGTDGAVTSQTGGVLGGSSTGSIQTIQFSAVIVNPILLVNFLNQSDVFNFGAAPFTLLDSNNATLAPPLLIGSVTAADTANDGFAVQISGTFGPGTPLVFLYSSNGGGPNGLQTVGFTVGTVQGAAAPEPGTLSLLALAGMPTVGAVARRRRSS